MKKIIITLALFGPLTLFAQKFDPETCQCKGKVMLGAVKIVDIGEDLKVKVVDIAGDLQVRKTDFPSRCGEWKFVDIGADFKVKFVDIGEDITIRYSQFIDQRLKTPPIDRSRK